MIFISFFISPLHPQASVQNWVTNLATNHRTVQLSYMNYMKGHGVNHYFSHFFFPTSAMQVLVLVG